MNELYPFTGHFFQLATSHQPLATRMHYLDEGAGSPVVMVHGNPTWSFYYRNLVIALRGSYRTIVPDHIGCGKSDKPDDTTYSYTLAQRADDLEALLDHLGIVKDITLIVHDWGGMIGMTYATRHPERIRRLVVLNTGAFHLPQTKPFPWSLWFCRHPQIGPVWVRGFNAFCRAAIHMCAKRRPLSAEVRKAYLEPYDSWAHRIAVLRFVQDIPLRRGDPSYDLVTTVQDNLAKLRGIPMLICWGDLDFVFDEHFLAEWKKRFPDAEVHQFADASHYVLEDAGEEIVPLIQKWLATE
ncbi:MAG: alpha/beta fold hydrolase [Gemmataceae bacterium]|nr:alpha/beta fold hydrolase [Gemmataceae bacterium]